MRRLKRLRGVRPAIEGLERRDMPATVAPAPHVVSVERLGVGHQRSRIVLTFDQQMDLTTTRNRGNYLLQPRNEQGRFNTAPIRTIRVIAAAYNATTQTVTLFPIQHLNRHRSYLLTVNGNLGGVSSAQGIVLEGSATPEGGGNLEILLPAVGQRPVRRR